jgi:DNA-binding CsgD family transcriptional regulator/energy-coupling factor transporter ATP-binding protein EcfA2
METGQQNQTPPANQTWMSVQQASDFLGIPAFVLHHWASEGTLPSERRDGDNGDGLRVNVSATMPVSSVELLSATSVVGRAFELAELIAVLEATSAGQGHLVVIGGETGIGKTTLVNAVAHLAHAGGFSVLTGQAFDVENPAPYDPWKAMFRRVRSSVALPPPPATLVEAQAPQAGEGSTGLFTDFERYLQEASRLAPLLLVLEDLHWADRPSLELLRFLARRIESLPVAIIMTFRDSELAVDRPLYQLHHRIVRESSALRLSLAPLDDMAIGKLVQQRYNLPLPDSERLKNYLSRYAEGNPFFIEELALHLEQEGVLTRSQHGWSLGDVPEFRVPPLLRPILASRIERLSEQALSLLRIAAVIGLEVQIPLWQQVSGATQDEMAATIDEALAEHLIVDAHQSDSIQFRHALIREALYDGLQILRRRAEHRRVAEILQEDAVPNPALVAHHFQLAHDRRAFDWLLAAGRSASLAFSYTSAIPQLEQALATLDQFADDPASRAWLCCELAIAYRYASPGRSMEFVDRAADLLRQTDDSALHAVFLLTRSHIRGFLGENALAEVHAAVEALDSLTPADHQRIQATSLAFVVSRGTLAQRIAYYGCYNDAAGLAGAVLASSDPPMSGHQHYDLGSAQIALGIASANLGSPDSASVAFAQARSHFEHINLHYMLGTVYAHEYRHVLEVYYPERVETRRQFIAAADHHFGRSISTDILANRHHERLFSALILDGRWSEAREALEAPGDTRYMQARKSEVLAELDWLQGRYDLAWLRIDEALPDGSSTAPSTPHYLEILNLQRIAAEVAIDQGDLDLAMDWIKAHLLWRDWGDSLTGASAADMLLARYHQAATDISTALEHARRAAVLAQQPRQPLAILRAERLAGELAGVAGHLDDAERHLGVAIDLARAIQAPYEIALCEIAYASLLIDRNQVQTARDMLCSARVRLTALNAHPALSQLEVVEERSGQEPVTSARVSGLSPRELEVLHLVAKGLTDAEIGDRLFISRRTVSGHLQSIFSKSGATSRAAATAFAFEHGLIEPDG